MRVLVLLVASVVAHPAAAADRWTSLGGGWERYTSARFGTVVEVPRHAFRAAEPPPDNSDGRQFKNSHGAKLSIYGSYGPYTVSDDFGAYKRWLLEQAAAGGLRVTYKAEGRDWIVISGIRGSDIIYERVVEGCGAGHHLSVEYPASEKALYVPLVTRMSKTLSCSAQKQPR